ncbi:MAG: DUF1538 domain-containing protein [Bacilli bacterium]|nr:DUF1538 domain-containing protein [Bacilli bacterium]
MSKGAYWLSKFLESLLSAAPIAAVIIVFYLLQTFAFSDQFSDIYIISLPEFLTFLVAVISIIIGMGLFNVGTEQSMTEIGRIIGSSLMKKKNLFFVLTMTFLLGVLVTVAEPDLSVLSSQIGVNRIVIILSIGLGVGLFLVIGVARTFSKKNLNMLFLAFYGLTFMLIYLINPRFLPVCFDAGGVTTGPVTVPFLLGFGLGLAATHGGKNSEDAFGLTALCSVGPIIAVVIISWIMGLTGTELPETYVMPSTSGDVLTKVGHSLLESSRSVAISVGPILGFFLIYEFIFVRVPWKTVVRIVLGMLVTYVGLVLFLSAVDYGFMPIASKVGQGFGSDPKFLPVAIVMGLLFGVFGVLAEPAVHVLVQQIEDVTEGAIKKHTVLYILAGSIGVAVVMAIIRSYFEFDVMYYLIPGYIIAFALSFFVRPIYTAMAFDSGGVASGPMTSTFVLPFCIGFAYSQGKDVYLYGFGLVALVAMMPLIVLQALGLVGGIKQSMALARARKRIVEENDDQVIHFAIESEVKPDGK